MKIGKILYEKIRVGGTFAMKIQAEYLSGDSVKSISFNYGASTLNLQGIVESVLSSIENNKPLPSLVTDVRI